MLRSLLICLSVCCAHLLHAQSLTLEKLQCEYLNDPLGIETQHPSLKWELVSSRQNVLQTAYRVLVADDSLQLQQNNGNQWDSKKILSSNSIQVLYAGKPLLAGKKYFWKVMVWDNKGTQSVWSQPASWQMGLTEPAAWAGAKWIAYEKMDDALKIVPLVHGNGKKEWGKRRDILPLLRTSFTITKELKQATAFISGLGQFEMHLNGKKVGDHFLDPGWTNYNQQTLYVCFDIKDYLRKGKNAIGVMLGNGFYYLPGERYRKMTGAYGYPEMIAMIRLEYKDGTVENIVSSENWKTAPSPVIFSSIYGGEDYDAGLEQEGWDTPDFNDGAWRNAIAADSHPLQAQLAEPVKVMQEFDPVLSNKLNDTTTVYDLGQNMSGIPQITVQGNRGDTVRITTAELLNENGTTNQRASGGPSYYQYILKGAGNESWQPRFSYYGFRYVQVQVIVNSNNKGSGHPTNVLQVKGLHTRNSAETSGTFNCSNELFNKTFQLIRWAVNSNMQSLFTDCPHRERLGWLEQLNLMGNSVQYNFDIHALARKVMADIRSEQNNNGLVPSTVPEYALMDFNTGVFRDSPEWGSTAVIFPWLIYQWYGDKEELKKDYSTMQQYVNYLRSRDSSHLLMYGLSDWYDLGPKPPGFCQLTPMGLTATAYYYDDLKILEKTARILNKNTEAVHYSKWADSVKAAFNKSYLHKDQQQYGSGSQTSNAMAVYMHLADEKLRETIVKNIVKDIQQNNGITSGDIGYHFLLKSLEEAGRNDVIFNMNNRTDVPGYGYQIAKGATALTESWQALPTASNNHFMLGHLMEWFYETLGGISQQKDGLAYSKIEIRPKPVGDISFAKTSYHSISGWIKTEWQKTGNKFDLDVEIPANTTAVVHLPNGVSKKIGSGKYHFEVRAQYLHKTPIFP